MLILSVTSPQLPSSRSHVNDPVLLQRSVVETAIQGRQFVELHAVQRRALMRWQEHQRVRQSLTTDPVVSLIQ